MQVRELLGMGHFLKKFIEEHNLPQKYQELIDSVNQAAQNQNPENVHTHLENLRKIHTEAENQILSPAQSKLLTDYGADKILGQNALSRLNGIFSEHQAHPQGLTEKLQELLNQTNQLAKKAKQLISILEPMLVELHLDSDELNENEGRLWLYFWASVVD